MAQMAAIRAPMSAPVSPSRESAASRSIALMTSSTAPSLIEHTIGY
jgi:hypothetical protein